MVLWQGWHFLTENGTGTVDATQHIPLSQAQAGDLVFFHSTYNAGTYVTHVGIYMGNNQMYHAGDPIGYTDLTSSYWQQHLIELAELSNRKEWKSWSRRKKNR